jgi:hypothetical protein
VWRCQSANEVGAAILLAAPPPEPDGRISRIRLSRRWTDSALASLHGPLDENVIRQHGFRSPSFVQRQADILIAQEALCPWREQPLRALRQPFLACALALLLPRPCLPLLHGRYSASSLLRRLCHLLGTVLRTSTTGHELRRCSQIAIPDSRRNAFLPFRPQSPSPLSRACSLAHHARSRRVASAPRCGFGSRLRLWLADSSEL